MTKEQLIAAIEEKFERAFRELDEIAIERGYPKTKEII